MTVGGFFWGVFWVGGGGKKEKEKTLKRQSYKVGFPTLYHSSLIYNAFVY